MRTSRAQGRDQALTLAQVFQKAGMATNHLLIP